MTEPGPVLDPIDALAQLAFRVVGAVERHAAEHDISLIQARLLGILRDREPTMAELAQMLSLDKSSVTGLVDRAERRGFVRRIRSETDRRSVRVVLIPYGAERVELVSAAVTDEVRQLLDPLTPAERDSLTMLATRVLSVEAGAVGIDLFPRG